MNTEKSFSSSHTTIISTSSVGGKFSSTPKEVSIIQRILWLGNVLYYQLVAVLTVVMLWVFFDNNELSSVMLWHMVLCTLAYVPLMAVAIISFSTDNLPTLYILRKRIYWIHGILLTISSLAVTIGISLEINRKFKRGSEHFKSIHAILGLTSWLLVFCSVCLGLVTANSQIFTRYVKPLVVKVLHNFLGISAFVLGVACFMVMMKSHHYKQHLSSTAYTASYYVAGYIIFWSLLAAFRSLFFQVKNIVSS